MVIQRKKYIEKLIVKKQNGLVKVISGLRRVGKSYLLFNLYYNYLQSIGVRKEEIITLSLDDDENIRYRNPLELGRYLREKISDGGKQYYVLIDEIQKVVSVQNPYTPGTEDTIGFVDVVLGLIKKENVDVYVTGSNSKMLSSDILTEFRGRSDEIRVLPLSYSEFYQAYSGDKHNAWTEYCTYGGMPFLLTKQLHEEKAQYLKMLFDKIYLSDIMERNRIKNEKNTLGDLLNILSSSVGSLTNAKKISDTFKGNQNIKVGKDAVEHYLDLFCDAFLLSKVDRYDVKGRKYIGSPMKYYFTDVGLRNARLNFRQQEENHIMENIIYNELIGRGYDVDVGIVEYNYKDDNKKSKRIFLEVDFVANKGSQKYYIQSAWNISGEEKRKQEIKSLCHIGDSFKKIIVIRDEIIPWHDEEGILYVGIEKFLLDERAMEL